MSKLKHLFEAIDRWIINNAAGNENSAEIKQVTNPYLNAGESVEFETPDEPQSTKRYKVLKVLTYDSGEGWESEKRGEWRIIDLKKEKVVATVAWSLKEDHAEYPERYFYHGPKRIEISDDETEARCYLTMENYTGFKFEGQDEPVGYEVIKLGDEI